MAARSHALDYDVDLEALESVVVALRAEREVLGALAADVDSETRLLHDEWHGAAALAHDARHARWQATLAEMDAALLALRELAALARGNYAAAADRSLALWQGLA